jgi:hypothetical protein
VTNEAPKPTECPAGVHSIYDPCPGDCGKLLEDTPPKATATLHDVADAFMRLKRPANLRERRDRYAALIREAIKGCTIPSLIPGQAPTLGATEYDLADAVLRHADTEHTAATAQAHAERDAALRLANVWDDAPDPLARAMARDLRSAIRGARPHTATEATVDQIRAERDQYAAALDKVRDFNKLVADGSCRVQAAEQARDTLHLLDRSLNAPTRPPHHEKGQS